MSHLIVVPPRICQVLKLSCSLTLGLLTLGGCAQPNGLADDTALKQETGLPEQTGTTTPATQPPVVYSSETLAAVVDTGAGLDTDTGIELPEYARDAIPPIAHLSGPPAANRTAIKREYLEV